ncbi:ribose-phosphate diphosphokinase [Planctomycetota bacterium]
MSFERDEILLFAGNSNLPLAHKICEHLEIPLGAATVNQFPDGEVNVKVECDIRGADLFILQSTCPPVNENLIELLVMVDCFKRASAGRITAVIPYFGYARKDRKDEGRVPITAKLVANMLTIAGVDRVVSMDLHAAQIQGFFDIPVDHLYGSPVIAQHYRDQDMRNLVVVAPDVGSLKRARAYSRIFDGDLAIIDKERINENDVRASEIIGNVAGKNVIITDDMIATGGTIVEAVEIVKAAGAGSVCVSATHGIFAGNCIERFRNLNIKEIVVTDTIPKPEGLDRLPVTYLSCADLLAETIRCIHINASVSSLFQV